MPKRRLTAEVPLDFAFFVALRQFYEENRGTVRSRYRDLTKRFLDHNDATKNASAYLRRPQFEALETYIFLKEYFDNAPVHALFADWRQRQGKFAARTLLEKAGQQQTLFGLGTEDSFAKAFDLLAQQLATGRRPYANYIFALTMGTGKTILMATCIFYEFLLANKFPKDPHYCHNALVFAPDTTVLEALREIQTFDMAKVVPPEYVNWLSTHIQFHFLDEAGMALSTLDRSMFNVIISNTQKVILKRQHKATSPADRLFHSGRPAYQPGSVYDVYSDLYEADEIDSEEGLTTNQRFEKLRRLTQLGIYVDEAHHAFGKNLARDVGAVADTRATSLRLTIDELAKSLESTGTHVVACYNYTGTPYAENQVLPEVVYAYGLREAIAAEYLKLVHINGYGRVRSDEFVRVTIEDFLKSVGDARHEGLTPKLAFFAATIHELDTELRPAVEAALARHNIPSSRILVNVGDEKLTKPDDIREFNRLDRPDSEKQFILLVGKGREGWNCRSLFGVALFRQPKSRIFVLQATMRCLRSIGQGQQTGHIYLSKENVDILQDELQQNFRITVDEIITIGKERRLYQVRVTTPLVKVLIKRERHLHTLREKAMPPDASLGLDHVDAERYRLIHERYDSLPDGQHGPIATEDISYIRDQRQFSRLTLVAEVARYLNRSCLDIEAILDQTAEGTDRILAAVNEHNELLYDWLIPSLFGHLYTLVPYDHSEEEEIALVKEPPEGFYTVTADPAKVVLQSDPPPANAARSFHLDIYCFDSNPELDLFRRLLKDDRVSRVFFTGMLTHGQTEFYVQYIDPDTHALRSYYPDFLIQKADNSYAIIEVKRDDQIDNPVVLAKADFARRAAKASGMTYSTLKGTECATSDYSFVFTGQPRPDQPRFDSV